MRRVLLALFLLSTWPYNAWAAQPSCDAVNPCTPAMMAIYSAYQAPTAHSPLLLGFPHVFSGECFHRSSYLDPRHKQYGVILLDEESDGYYMNGAFALQQAANPYEDWNIAEARKRLSNLYHDERKLLLFADHVEVNIFPLAGNKKIAHYWLKWDSSKSHLLLLAQWALDHTFFCSLSPNE